MPSSCCVPGCTSNYKNKENVNVFKFPKDPEKRNKWLRSIQRDFVVTDSSVVCVKHFAPNHLDREHRALRPDGTTLILPRKRLKLTQDAYPTIFLDFPKHATETVTQFSTKVSETEEEEITIKYEELDVKKVGEVIEY